MARLETASGVVMHELKAEQTHTVGREAGPHKPSVSLPSSPPHHVSRLQCTLVSSREWLVTEGKPANPTAVNGQPLKPHESRLIVDGDNIAFGCKKCSTSEGGEVWLPADPRHCFTFKLILKPEPAEEEVVGERETVVANRESTASAGERALATVEKLSSELECAVCNYLFIRPMTTQECSHTVCSSCLVASLKRSNKRECPMCRGIIAEPPVYNRLLANAVDQLLEACSDGERADRAEEVAKRSSADKDPTRFNFLSPYRKRGTDSDTTAAKRRRRRVQPTQQRQQLQLSFLETFGVKRPTSARVATVSQNTASEDDPIIIE